MSLKPRPVPTMFSPPWTRRTPSPVTFPIKILKRDKRLVNRCTVNETPRLRMENFRSRLGSDRRMMDYFAALSFLSLSLSFWRAITFQIRIETMKDSIFGSFLNSSRVIDRYFYKDFK